MKGKNLVVLLVAAVILGLLAFVTSRQQQTAPPELLGKKIFPELNANDIARVVVTDGTGSVTVERGEKEWRCTSLHGYPANFTKLKNLLLVLEELKIGQTVALTDAEREQLQMVAPNAPAATAAGTLVELADSNGRVVASLLVGASHERPASGPDGGRGGYPDGKYISTDGGKTVYLVADMLTDVSRKDLDWIDADLLNVPSADVKQVTIVPTNGPTLTLSRESGNLLLPDLADTEEMDASKLYGVDGAFNYLRINGVADPALTDAELGMTTPSLFTMETKDGRLYTAHIGATPSDSDNRYMRFDVALKPAPPKTEEGEQDKASEDKEAADARAQKEQEVADLNAKLKDWTFLISSYKAEGMTRQRADLVKEKENEKEKSDDEESATDES